VTVSIEVSYGELIDKISILEIKAARIVDPKKQQNLQRELTALNIALRSCLRINLNADVIAARINLKAVNEKLWDIEDAIRVKERNKAFDTEFIELARSVYIINDERARLKRCIDEWLGSRFSEEKSYLPY